MYKGLSSGLAQFFVILFLFFVDLANCVETYDFIVVGAGAGGCATARRLAENGRFRVLLIESGGIPKEGYDIPAFSPQVVADTNVTFNFDAQPQEHAALMNNGTVSIVSGRMLGGTTSINYMWFNRGHPYDWNNWAKLTGDPSWEYKNMIPFFKRIETYRGEYPSEQHGHDGPITVSRPQFSPGIHHWLQAGQELGYPTGDSNGPQQRMFAPVEYSKRNGRRVTAFTGYVQPILHMPNIQVLLNTNVTHVLFEGNRAIGVALMSNNTNVFHNEVFASKEVILSAGSYSSAFILQRSGIGPREFLEPAGIPIIRELPVGFNYQDHPAVNLNFIINDQSLVFSEARDLTPQNYQLLETTGDGPYSITRGGIGQALIATSVAVADGTPDWPDMQLCGSHSTMPYLSFGGDNLYQTAAENLAPGEAAMSSSIWMGRPKSRGKVRINPKNPLEDPIIELGYLLDPRDMQMYMDSIQETLRIFETTETYKKLGARYAPTRLPACNRFPVKSKGYWDCYVRQTIGGGCHPAGTNRMGKADDPAAVVDSELRVIGTERLRVIDASIMPFVVNANPTAAIYGIAEKGADMILRRWEYPLAEDVKEIPKNRIAGIPQKSIFGTPENKVVGIPQNSIFGIYGPGLGHSSHSVKAEIMSYHVEDLTSKSHVYTERIVAHHK